MTAHRPRRHHDRVTSFDVAREAKVSQATVSRAFTTPEVVSDSARQRVFAAAERLGYAPNAIARSLASNSSRIVGVVVPANSEFYGHALTLFARQLTPHGYQLLLFEYDIGTDIAQVLRAVRSYQVDALIVSAMIIGPAQAAGLRDAGIRIIMFNYVSEDETLPYISVDSNEGTARLAQLLLDTGHHSVVFAGGLRSSSADRVRYRGASETLAAGGVPCRYVETGAFTYEAGVSAVDDILAHEPDAIMAASDSIAFGIIDGLRALGVRVPADISVTGFNGLPQAAWKAYDLTTIEQPMDALVAATIDVAVTQATSGEEPKSQVIAGSLQRRSTVADRRIEVAKGG